MQRSVFLGRWVIVCRPREVGSPRALGGDPSVARGYRIDLATTSDLDDLRRRGTKGERDAELFERADVAIVARSPDGAVLHFRCAALSDFQHPGLPFSVRVPDGQAFLYHSETFREARGQGIARQALAFNLRLFDRGDIERTWAHTDESHATVRRYYAENGLEEVGWLVAVAFGQHVDWLTFCEQPLFASAPTLQSDGVSLHREQSADAARLAYELSSLLDTAPELRIALYGSGVAAEQLLLLCPRLQQHVVAVVDSDPARQQATFAPTGHVVGAPESWQSTGAGLLMYASQAWQDEMVEAHRRFGPAGSKGIRLHPKVEVIEPMGTR